MEQKHMIIIGILIAVIAMLAVGILMVSNSNKSTSDANGASSGLNLDLGSMGKTVIKVSSDNPDISGKMEVYEFRNIKQNENRTWNLSEFGDYYGLLGFYGANNGAKHDIMIKNGTAEYEIQNDTQVIFIYYFITNICGEGNITVDFNVNGVQKFSSTSDIYSTIFNSSQCDISWGDRLITVDGNIISDNDLIPDTEHNKFVTK